MRPLEILIPIILAIYTLWSLVAPRPRALAFLPILAVLLLFIHLAFEGGRWQMLPLYLLVIVLVLTILPILTRANPAITPRASGWSSAGLSLVLVLLLIGTAVPVLIPVPTLMAPTGPYSVGTITRVLTDPLRREIYSGKDEPRRFMLEIWYPGVPPIPGTKPAPWMPEAKIVAPAIADYIKLPHFFLDHLTLAKSNSYTNLPLNKNHGPYPVLIFSHGWNGFRQQSTFLMQELASHGYIVIALEHPYGARLTVFPDGSLAPNNPSALPKDKPEAEYEAAAQILVKQWTGDIGFALDFLTSLDQNDPNGQFTGQLILNKVGVFGHSTGGGAAIQFCGTDLRCTVGLTLDAFTRPISPAVLDRGTKQPFLYLFSELWPFERNTDLFNRYYSHVPPSNRVLTILGADHYDFTDLPALSPLAPQLGLKGPINANRVQQIIDTYVLAYFDQQLKGIPTSLFDAAQPAYPDVRYDH